MAQRKNSSLSAAVASTALLVALNTSAAFLQLNSPEPESDAMQSSTATSAFKTDAMCHDVSVQVLGSGGPELDDGRTSTGYVVWVNEKARIIVDAGSGSSVQFGDTGAHFEHIDALLLSHLHTDHAADLPSYVKGGYFTNRESDLAVYGPAGNNMMPATSAYVNALLGDDGAFRYLSSYTNEGEDDYTIHTTDIASTASNQPLLVTIDSDISAEALSVPHGPIPTLAWKVMVNGCTVVFSGDTSDADNALASFARNADLLVLHNAIPDNASSTAKNLHMTPTQLIDIAKQSKAKRILLSHIMKRSEAGLSALTEAITVVAPGRVYAAEELMNITLE